MVGKLSSSKSVIVYADASILERKQREDLSSCHRNSEEVRSGFRMRSGMVWHSYQNCFIPALSMECGRSGQSLAHTFGNPSAAPIRPLRSSSFVSGRRLPLQLYRVPKYSTGSVPPDIGPSSINTRAACSPASNALWRACTIVSSQYGAVSVASLVQCALDTSGDIAYWRDSDRVSSRYSFYFASITFCSLYKSCGTR